jgi:hypothetical protein
MRSGVITLKSICKIIGKCLLGMAAFITFAGPASISSVAVEEIPESMRKKR